MTSLHSSDCFERVTCRLCSSPALDLAIPLAATPPGDHYLSREQLPQEYPAFPLAVLLCATCGHLQLSHVVSPRVLYGNYIYTSSISLGLNQHFVQYAQDLSSFSGGLDGKFVVDVGSNDGSCLRAFCAQGAKVRGIEPAHAIAQLAEESGIPTTNAFFDVDVARHIVDAERSADVILANNVFANIDDLDEVMVAVKSLLARDGLFVFETGYAVDLLESKIIDNIYHEHLSYFSVRPLIHFFHKHDMQVVRVEYSPSKGGSIRVFVCSLKTSRKCDPSVGAFVHREKFSEVFKLSAYRALNQLICEEGVKLRQLLSDEKRAGRVVLGFGASVGVTTLLHLFQVGEVLECLVDDNKMRHGLYSPGYHLAVQPSSMLLECGPATVVVFPWRYIDPIMKSNENFLSGGGRFIVPLPEVRILTGER